MPKAPVVVVANPVAGRGKGERLLPKVREFLTDLCVDHEVEVSTGPDDPEEMAREAAERGARMIVALGGDGLVGMVANGLVGSETAMGVVPAGAGNDFARSLGINHRRPLSVAPSFARASYRRVDAVRVTTAVGERVFVNVAGAGFDSEVNETANAMRSKLSGTSRYVVALARTLKRFDPAEFDVEVDGRQHRYPAMLIALGNGRSYGGGMKVCPNASLDDGMLDICVVGAMSKARFLRAFPGVFRGTHVRNPRVTMDRGSEVRIHSSTEAVVYADGERVGPLPATFRVLPAALEVLQP
jgi:diacylglycerol kinase (ATP)